MPYEKVAIEPGKPNQNANIESVNGRLATNASASTGFPACCTHAPRFERWRLEYNEERLKKTPGELTTTAMQNG